MRGRRALAVVLAAATIGLLPAAPATAVRSTAVHSAAVHSAAVHSAPVHADPSLADLRAQADALRHRLDQLGVEQGLAVERYDAAQEALQQATTDQVLAGTRLQDLQRSAADAQSAGGRRARAIYISGGSLGLTATVLESSSIADVLTRWRAVETLVGADASNVRSSGADLTRQAGVARSVERARTQTATRQATAARAVAAVQASLQAQQQLLASTDSRVVELAREQQQTADAQALAEAAMSAARMGIGNWPGSAGSTGGSTGGSTADAALPPAPNATVARAIAAARSRIGRPYVWGATGPDSFDCSGLTSWAYRQAGVSIPRTSRAQYAALPKVALDQLAPGDLVFYATDVSNPATIHHVGLYLGAGLSVYAPQTGDNVKIGPVGYGTIIGAVRPVAH